MLTQSAYAELFPFLSLPERFVVIDTETTGFPTDEQPWRGLLQIGLAEVVGTEVVKSTLIWVNPEEPVEAQATEVHGITDEMVQDQPAFHEGPHEVLQSWVQDQVVVFHNAVFDWSKMILGNCARYGLENPSVQGVFCSQKNLAMFSQGRMVCTDRGPRLDRVTEHFGLRDYRGESDGLHGAEIDAIQTADYLIEIRKLLRG